MTTHTVTTPGNPVVRQRLPVGAAITHVGTLTKRSLLKIKADPEELLGFTVQPIMFVLLFVYVFGGALAGNTERYLQFALPGIIVQSVIFATMGTGLGLNTDIGNGVFDRFRSLPISRWAPLAAQVFGDIVRYALSAVILLSVGVLLGFRIQTGFLSAVAALGLMLVFAVAICWVSCLVGLLVRTTQGVQMFAMTLMFPITFASTVFVRAESMPGWLQVFVENNPVTHLATAIRGLLLGGQWEVVAPTVWTLLWAAGIVAVFAPLSVWAYLRRV